MHLLVCKLADSYVVEYTEGSPGYAGEFPMSL